jgi:quercetin dioxygenase-like cupin family protein
LSTVSIILGQRVGLTRTLHEGDAGVWSITRFLYTVRLSSFAVEIWGWRLAPNESFDGAAHPAGTIEFLSVLRGTLTVKAAEETVTARAGSTARFSADTPHRYANLGSVACEFQMVVLEPVG